MKLLDDFERIIDKRVERLYLIVWPPEHEVSKYSIDISVGLILRGGGDDISRVRIIAENGCCPEAVEFKPGNILDGSSFERRIDAWMDGTEQEYFELEYYDVTKIPVFGNIVGGKIEGIKYLVTESKDIYCVKLQFSNDYIIVSPISDGSTVETSKFNKLDNIDKILSPGSFEWIDHQELRRLLQ